MPIDGVVVPVVLLREAKRASDTDLAEYCQGGDTSAFDEIVRRYKDRVYHLMYRILGNHEDALDTSQEVFVRAYGGIKTFRGASQIYTWLYRIAMNLAQNRLRDQNRKGRNCGVSLESINKPLPVSKHYNPRTQAEGHELDEALQACLNELPEACRKAFVLRVIEEFSYEEIAGIMQCPEGTVKSRINQARRILRNRLQTMSLV